MAFAVVTGCGAKHDGIRVFALCCIGYSCQNHLRNEGYESEEKASS